MTVQLSLLVGVIVNRIEFTTIRIYVASPPMSIGEKKERERNEQYHWKIGNGRMEKKERNEKPNGLWNLKKWSERED